MGERKGERGGGKESLRGGERKSSGTIPYALACSSPFFFLHLVGGREGKKGGKCGKGRGREGKASDRN